MTWDEWEKEFEMIDDGTGRRMELRSSSGLSEARMVYHSNWLAATPMQLVVSSQHDPMAKAGTISLSRKDAEALRDFLLMLLPREV